MCANVVSGREDHEFCTVEGKNIATGGKSTNTKTKYSKATVYPPSPRKPMLGRGRLHPPFRVEKILHLNIGLGGKGCKRERVQCLCCIMDGFVSVSSDGAIFIPPTDWGRGFAIILRSAPRGISLGSASRDDSRKVELRQTGQAQLGNPS